MDIYLVGGAVRDELLGLPVKDRDWVVTGAAPDELQRLGYKQVGADFPVFLHPKTGEEYALARTERKNGQGYHGFTVYSAPDVTLEQDLQRRDLTINAMARAEDGALIDPFQGQQDLEARRLRHVSGAFTEDPLRILRTARFAARFAPLGFRVASDTHALMSRMVADDEMAHLAPERVWQEIVRALQENDPATFFQVLRACGALDALIPELADERIYTTAMSALGNSHARNLEPQARYAALLSPLSRDAARQRSSAMKAPNEFATLSELVSDLAPDIRNQTLTQPDALLAILDKADAWRRPERFDLALRTLACVLDERDSAKLEVIASAYQAASSVSAKKLMAEGYEGKALGQAIREERCRRIDDLLNAGRDA